MDWQAFMGDCWIAFTVGAGMYIGMLAAFFAHDGLQRLRWRWQDREWRGREMSGSWMQIQGRVIKVRTDGKTQPQNR